MKRLIPPLKPRKNVGKKFPTLSRGSILFPRMNHPKKPDAPAWVLSSCLNCNVQPPSGSR